MDESHTGKNKTKKTGWNFSFCFKFQSFEKKRAENEKQTEGEERGTGLGSDVWTQEEEELWCRSLAQIRFSHKSLKLQRERRLTVSLCLTVYLTFCLSVGLSDEDTLEGVKVKQQQKKS